MADICENSLIVGSTSYEKLKLVGDHLLNGRLMSVLVPRPEVHEFGEDDRLWEIINRGACGEPIIQKTASIVIVKNTAKTDGVYYRFVLFFESIGSTFEQALKALNNENWGCDYKYYWSAPHCCQVGVSVNGVDKSFEYSIDEPVEDIRKRIGDDLFNYFNFTDICTEHPYINNPN